MHFARLAAAIGVSFWLGGVHAQQSPSQPAGTTTARVGTPKQSIGGSDTIALTAVDARGWGWQFKAHAEEIAATAGVDVIIFGNNDLSAFSGWQQSDPRYQDALIKVRNAALKYGKYYGNAGQQSLSGYVVSADTRMVQDGPAGDGWQRPARGGPAAREEGKQ